MVVLSVVIIGYVVCKIGLDKIQNSDNKMWWLLLTLDTATAIALVILAFFAYWEYAKGEDEIELLMY